MKLHAADFCFCSTTRAIGTYSDFLDVHFYSSSEELVFRYRWPANQPLPDYRQFHWATVNSNVRAMVLAVTYNDQAASAALSDLLQELGAPEWLWRFFAGDADWWQSTPHAKAVSSRLFTQTTVSEVED